LGEKTFRGHTPMLSTPRATGLYEIRARIKGAMSPNVPAVTGLPGIYTWFYTSNVM